MMGRRQRDQKEEEKERADDQSQRNQEEEEIQGLKKTRDLGLRSGMVVKCMAEDGTVLEGTVQKRTMKKSGKSNNNFDVRNNTSGEVIEDVNFDRVVWYIEVE